MSRTVKYLAWTWALLAGPIVLATFMGMDFFAARLVAVTGLHVHPLYTGGEIAQTLDHEGYRTILHRPVFDGLVGQRDAGFVQIEWRATDANLPESIDEQIDFDRDGKADARIRLNTSTDTTTLEPLDSRVVSADAAIRLEKARIVRLNLRKQPR